MWNRDFTWICKETRNDHGSRQVPDVGQGFGKDHKIEPNWMWNYDFTGIWEEAEKDLWTGNKPNVELCLLGKEIAM